MAESVSNRAMLDSAGEGAVAGSIDRAAAPEAVLTEDGVPVVDLRAATDAGGVFVVVDGTLLLRLADGTEWPIDPTTADGSVVLQLTDQGYVAASSIQAALAGADTALPLSSLVAATIQATTDSETVGDAAPPAEPEAAGDAPVHGGGAAFRTFEIQELGSGLDPVLALGPTDLGFGSNRFDDELSELAANTPGNGGRFVDLAPIANDDLAVTDERRAITIDVLANDRDPNPDDRIRIVDVQADHLLGIVSLNVDGTITYDPNGQFTQLGLGEQAVETFTYTIADRLGKTSTATVTVVIEGVNDAPLAADDVAETTEKTAVLIDVLTNDSDPDINDVLGVVAVDVTGLQGDLTYLGDGVFAYDPAGQFDYLGLGQTATATFQYAVADQHGAVDIATVEIVIEGVNDAPVANDDEVVTDEKTPVAFDVLANDDDPDIDDLWGVVAVDPTGLVGDLAYLGDGVFAYDPAGRFDFLGKGQTATESFQYMIADEHGAFDIATVEIVIHGVNDAPVANDDIVIVSEKGEVRFDALANDFDPDQGDVIEVANLFSLGGSKGQRWINHDGTITYRPAGAYDYLGEGEFAIQEFGYTITDQHGATDTATVTVIVVGVNDAPVAKDDKAVTDEKTAVVVNVLANDYDPDINDVFGVVAVDLTGLQGNLTYLGDGKFAYDPNGQFDYLAKGHTATESFRYMISDQHGATDIATVEILIHGVNDAPTAVDDHFVGFETIGFYAPIEALLANDYDVDQGDTFHFAGIGNAVNGQVSLTPDGYVVFTPDAGYVGPAGFQYAIVDQHGAYGIGDVYVEVRPIEPGDMNYQALSWFNGVSQAEVEVLDNGVTLMNLVIEVAAVAGVGLEIGGMPFYSATLGGVLQGVISVALLPDGTPLVDGNLAGDLDLQIETSPIFAPLGGDVYDALFAATGGAEQLTLLGGGGGGLPAVPDLGFADALFDLFEQVVQSIDFGGIETLVAGQGLGDSNAIAFGNGVFSLDISGLISGAIEVPGGHQGAPLVDAEIFGHFAAAAIMDIRDDLTVVSDGFVTGDFDVAVAPSGVDAGFAIGSIVSEEPALAA